MDENEVKDLKNKAKELLNTVDPEKEISTIAVAVKLEGLDQVNEELDKMLIKLEKANSSADELTSKLKTYGIDGNEVARAVSETIHTENQKKKMNWYKASNICSIIAILISIISILVTTYKALH